MKKLLFTAIVSACLGGLATHALAEPQPHMRKALASLEDARAQLEKASADKGGHRVKALALVTEAIDQVKKGIEFDNKH